MALSIIETEPIPVKNIPFVTLLFIQATAMITFGVFFFYLWSMGSFLNFLVTPPLRMSLGFFRFALVFPLIYGLAFPLVAWVPRGFAFYVVLPIHLFVMFCILCAFRFIAKSLALQEEVRFLTVNDYYRTFFLWCLFPIGVWLMQSKINRRYVGQGGELTEVPMLKSQA